ncbi:MAG: hypothetical protein Q9212_001182 [Teloschistes hypoglaucus]
MPLPNMPLPKNLLDKYTSLKDNTKYFTTWLVTNARSPGIRSKDHSGTQPYASKNARRHKGDKQSKKQSLQMTNEVDTPVDTEAASTTISVNELLSLAKSLLDIAPTIDIPRSVIQAAKAATNARIQCSKWFAQHIDITPDIKRSNQSHAHFNAVLQQILDILLSLEGSQTLTQHDREISTVSNDQTRLSFFESLETEDILSDVSDSNMAPAESSRAAAQRPARTLPTLPGPAYTIAAPEDEWLTALSCALQDMRSLRNCIRRHCHQYKSGEIDCGTLSMTANTAVDMVEQLESQLYQSTPPTEGPMALLDHFEHHSRQARNQVRAVPNFINTDDIGQHVYSLPRRALEVWTSFCCGRKVSRSPHLGQDWQQTEADLELLDSTTRQMYCLKDFWVEDDHTNTEKIPLLDRFTIIAVGLGRDAKRSSVCITLYAVFAAQLFLDIHHILGGEKCNQGLQDLQAATAKHQQIFESYQQFSRSVYAKRRLPKPDSLLQKALSRIETWVREDVVEKARGQIAKEKYGLDIKASKPKELLASHPWLCGALRFGFDVMSTLAGIMEWNYYDYVEPLAHIYNAAWQEGYLDAQWADMEMMLDMYPSKDILAGSRPVKGNSYGAQHQRSGGIAAVNFAKNRRTNQAVVKKKGATTALPGCPHVALLYWTHTLAGPNGLCPDIPMLVLMLEEAPHKINSDYFARSETLRLKWLDQRQPLSPAEMMTFAKERLLGERELIRFNYLGMVQRCHHLGRRLVERIDDICSRLGYYDPVEAKKYDTVEYGMHITGWIACVSYERKNQQSHTPLRNAVTELLKEFIRTEGDTESKALESTHLMEARTAEAPKIQTPASMQPSILTQPSVSTQPKTPAPSRKGKEKEVLPSTSTASDWLSNSTQEESMPTSRKGKEKEVLPSISIASSSQSASIQGESSQPSRKGKEKEKLPFIDEGDETDHSEGSGQSNKGEEKEDLPSTSTASNLPSTSNQGEPTQSGQKAKKKRKGKKKKSKGKKKEVLQSSEPVGDTAQSKDNE